jgi:hypothetical protein
MLYGAGSSPLVVMAEVVSRREPSLWGLVNYSLLFGVWGVAIRRKAVSDTAALAVCDIKYNIVGQSM